MLEDYFLGSCLVSMGRIDRIINVIEENLYKILDCLVIQGTIGRCSLHS